MFFWAKRSATAEGENCIYGPTLLGFVSVLIRAYFKIHTIKIGNIVHEIILLLPDSKVRPPMKEDLQEAKERYILIK